MSEQSPTPESAEPTPTAPESATPSAPATPPPPPASGAPATPDASAEPEKPAINTDAQGVQQGMRPKTPWHAYIRPILWCLVLLYVVIFVFVNNEQTTINFLFAKVQMPLFFVLLGTTLIGALLGILALVQTRRSSERKTRLKMANQQAKSQ